MSSMNEGMKRYAKEVFTRKPPSKIMGELAASTCSLTARIKAFDSMWLRWISQYEDPEMKALHIKQRQFFEDMWMEGWRAGFNAKANSQAEAPEG